MNMRKQNTTLIAAGISALLGTTALTGCGSSQGKAEVKKDATASAAPALASFILAKDNCLPPLLHPVS